MWLHAALEENYIQSNEAGATFLSAAVLTVYNSISFLTFLL